MKFKSFKGIRPSEELAKTVASKNISEYENSKINDYIKSNKEAFISILSAGSKEENNNKRFQGVRERFDTFNNECILEQDKSVYYVYQQILPDGRSFSGVIGALRLEEESIVELEKTIPKRTKLFTDYLKEVDFQADPIVLCYEQKHRVDVLLEVEMKKKPFIYFTTDDSIEHKVWKVDSVLVIKQIKESIESLNEVHVLDGHHRYRSTLAYGDFMKNKDEEHIGTEPYNYIMSFLIAHNQVQINGYHRLIGGLDEKTKTSFIQELKKVCRVIPKGETAYYPSDRHYASLYMDGQYYLLFLGNSLESGLFKIDSYFLQEKVLKPVLGIDPKTAAKDKLLYLPGTGNEEGMKGVKKMIDNKSYDIGLCLYPPPMTDLFSIDKGETLPPKSFYILPRFLSGLFMMDTKE